MSQKRPFLRHKGDTSRWVAASITDAEAAKFFESLAALEFHKFSPRRFSVEAIMRQTGKLIDCYSLAEGLPSIRCCDGITKRSRPKRNPQGAGQMGYWLELLGEVHGVDPYPGSIQGLPLQVLCQAIDQLHLDEGDEEKFIVGNVSQLLH
jgi:hypothetical protein